MRVDTIFHNGMIRGDMDHAPAAAMAVNAGRIVAIGSDCAGLEARRRVDLHGYTVVAGFHDAHNHMVSYGLSLDELDLSSPPIVHVDEIYDLVARRAAEQDEATWIVGRGYDQNKLIGGHPLRSRLDRAAPRHHVWLQHTSGHMCTVNSKVLDRLDLDAPIEGGDVVTDEEGTPTGLLREQAQLLMRPLVYPLPSDVLARAIARAGEHFAAEGLTSVQEAGVGGGWIGHSPVEIAAYQDARDRGDLRVRATLMIALESLHELVGHDDDAMRFGVDLGIRSGFGDDWLRIGPVKVFADGSLIGRTAALSSGYADEPGNVGYFQLPVAELRTAIGKAHQAGWQVATHAIGDLAVSEVITAYAMALHDYPRRDHRHRIEHCGISRPEDVARMAALGIIPVPQGRFVNEIGDGMLRALGPERINWCYRARSFLDAGLTLPASSDRPVVRGAPLLGLADLVERRSAEGVVLAPQERLTPAEAVRAYTWGSAYAAFREDTLGTLEAGKLADFVVLSADPLAVLDREVEEGQGLEVVATVVGGVSSHDPGGLIGASGFGASGVPASGVPASGVPASGVRASGFGADLRTQGGGSDRS